MDKKQVFEKVKGYILEQLDVSEDRVVESASVVEDLGADSANLMMLVMDLESEFNLTVEDEAITTLRTVGDIVDYIAEKA
ncbi:MAG: acyl carrier protein [Christensenellales bacterium]|nr:acyl carrier protein [Christensenellales bacterium]